MAGEKVYYIIYKELDTLNLVLFETSQAMEETIKALEKGGVLILMDGHEYVNADAL